MLSDEDNPWKLGRTLGHRFWPVGLMVGGVIVGCGLLVPTAHLLRTQAASWAFTGGEGGGSNRILFGVRQHNVRLLRVTAAT